MPLTTAAPSTHPPTCASMLCLSLHLDPLNRPHPRLSTPPSPSPQDAATERDQLLRSYTADKEVLQAESAQLAAQLRQQLADAREGAAQQYAELEANYSELKARWGLRKRCVDSRQVQGRSRAGREGAEGRERL